MCFTRKCSIHLKEFCFEVTVAVCEWERLTEVNLCPEDGVCLLFVCFLAAERFRFFIIPFFLKLLLILLSVFSLW